MNLKQIYAFCLKVYSSIFGVDAAKTFDTAFRFKRKLDLKNPKTLADKVSYIELHLHQKVKCQSRGIGIWKEALLYIS